MTTAAHVVWTDVELTPVGREILARAGVVREDHAEGDTAGLETADALIAGSRIIGNAALFARAPRLRVLARVGIGHERIDLAAATAAGVCVVNTPDAPTESTAEFAMLLLLAVLRRLPAGQGPLSSGRWIQGSALIGSDLAGKVLGLVGCGRIGRRVAELARAFGMDVVAFDPLQPVLPPGVRPAPDLAQLLEQADAISLHAPATAATRHLLDRDAFARMKTGAVLVNTARGLLVDGEALREALDSGRLAGAALDVWDPEPPAADLPLLRHPAVIATPHMAASTREGRNRSHADAARQALQVLRDERPDHLVNPAVWPQRRRPA